MNHNKLREILQSHYSLTGRLEELVAYQDLNFVMHTVERGKVIVKISVLPEERAFVLAQNEVLLALQDSRFPVPIPTYSQEYYVDLKEFKGTGILRVFPFIEGRFLVDSNPSLSFYYDLGSTLAQLNVKLSQFRTADLLVQSHEWDLTYFQSLRKELKHIVNPELKRLIHFFFMKHKQEVLPGFTELPKGLIHHDANDYNILLDPTTEKLCGLIDFGDMVYGPRVHEISIALAYALMGRQDLLGISKKLVAGYHSISPLSETEIAKIYYLIAARLCTTIIFASKKAEEQPNSEYHQVSMAPGIALLFRWIQVNPFAFADELLDACLLKTKKTGEELQSKTEKKLADRHITFSRALSVSYNKPIEMLGSALQYMYGSDGKTYLDCVNNIPHVGHCHPLVVEAGQRQMAKLNTNTRYLYDSLTDYANQLVATLPETLSKVYFVNSGSAATDLAIRLAKQHTGRDDFVVLDHAYHGNTTTAISLSPYKFSRKGGPGKPDTTLIIPSSTYTNPPTHKSTNQPTHQPNNPPAAFIAESIPGCAGQVMLDPTFMKQQVDEIHDQGGLYIADEVQTGFARVGEHFWGFQLYDVIPDIVILGKPIANGHPMGAVVCSEAVAKSFETGMEFFSSFGGNPVSCEIAKAVLEAIQTEDLQNHAAKTGTFLLQQLQQLQQDVNNSSFASRLSSKTCISSVRGSGFFLGIEFVKSLDSTEPDPETASILVNQLKEKGFLLSTDGPNENVIKFKPPMCFTKENADALVQALRDLLMD